MTAKLADEPHVICTMVFDHGKPPTAALSRLLRSRVGEYTPFDQIARRLREGSWSRSRLRRSSTDRDRHYAMGYAGHADTSRT